MLRMIIASALLLMLAWPAAAQDRERHRQHCESEAAVDRDGRIAACTALIDASTEPSVQLATDLLHRALAHVALGNDEAALADLDQAALLSPKDGRTYLARAALRLRRRHYEQAVRDFSEAIRLGQDGARSFHGRGRANLGLVFGGTIDQATRDFNAAVEREPGNAAIWVDLGDSWTYRVLLYLYVQDYNQEVDSAWRRRDLRLYRSIRDHDHVVGSNPPDFASYQTAPGLRHEPHRRAMAAYDAAIRLDPANVRALTGRGTALVLNGEPRPAIEAFNAALRHDPANVVALTSRGVAWRDIGEPDRAIEDYDAVLRLGPRDNAAVLTARGNAFIDKAALARAIESFDAAIRANPRYPAAFDNRGVARLRIGAYDRAIDDFTEAIRLRLWNPSAHRHRCLARALAGQRGVPDCDQSEKIREDHATTREIRGLVHLLSGNTRAAIDQFDAILEKQPTRASALYSRGVAHLRRGNTRAGAGDIAIAMGIRPDIAEVMATLGVK